MKLEVSGRTEIAISAIRELRTRDGASVKAAELAELLGTTANYLPQVLRPLVRRGWITSDRGPTGGYRFTADATEVSLFEVLEAVEGPWDENRCVLRGKPCPAIDLCVLHEPWQRARGALVAELKRTTVADLPLERTAV